MSKIELTFTQCKQIINNGHDIRDFVESINDQPEWMVGGMGIASICELQAILQSGCAANAHRSVYYYDAQKVMAGYGDEVLDYIENQLGDLPNVTGQGWSQMASTYLSCAVELWCSQFADTLDGVNWD